MDRWRALQDGELTSDDVNDILFDVSDDLWVISACVDRVVDSVDVQRDLLNLGLKRSLPSTKRIQLAVEEILISGVHSSLSECAASYFATHPEDQRVCDMRRLLLQRRDLLLTYQEIAHSLQDEAYADENGDPWNLEGEFGVSRTPLTLSSILLGNIVHTAMTMAMSHEHSALVILFRRHWNALSPHRFAILESIPEHVDPNKVLELLPRTDSKTNVESFPDNLPWRELEDWVEKIHRPENQAVAQPLRGSDIADWYIRRAHHIEHVCGLSNQSEQLLHLGSSLHNPDLAVPAQDFRFFAAFILSAARHPSQPTALHLSFHDFKQLDPTAVVSQYLAPSTAETIVEDIQGTVLPFLLSSDTHHWQGGGEQLTEPLANVIIQAPLLLVAPICDASKPGQPLSKRIIRHDLDLVKISLACLYGSNSLDEWSTMSMIFECLPVWDEFESDDQHQRDPTLQSLEIFLSSAGSPSSRECYVFFSSMPKHALSFVLDSLDVQLEAGEIFAKWGVPTALRCIPAIWVDAKSQRSWAAKMARSSSVDSSIKDSVAPWIELLDDMLSLVQGSGSVRGAFGLLGEQELKSIFYGALLSTSKFDVAAKLLGSPSSTHSLPPQVVQSLCLSISREFFDNANSGNIHHGDMKAAYDCLAVAPLSDPIRKEREFIEAASRICSFNLLSNEGVQITPLEIRLTKDRVDLITGILSQTPQAYKYPDMLLELANKLGFRGDLSVQIKLLVAAAQAAMHDEDFEDAAKHCRRAVDLLESLGIGRTQDGSPAQGHISWASLVDGCWQLCFQLGKQQEYSDTQQKLILLGYSLRLCPPDHISHILSIWRLVEMERDRLHPPDGLQHRSPVTVSFPNLRKGLSSTRTKIDGTNIASKTLSRVTASFPFSSSKGSDPAPTGTSDMSTQARHALSRGIGWLIGGDDPT